jgi:hypothetical protein
MKEPHALLAQGEIKQRVKYIGMGAMPCLWLAVYGAGLFQGFAYQLFDFAYDVLPEPFQLRSGGMVYQEKLIHFDSQSPGEAFKDFRSGKVAGNFHHGKVMGGNSGFFSQFFLRKTAFPAVFPQIFPKNFPKACHFFPPDYLSSNDTYFSSLD